MCIRDRYNTLPRSLLLQLTVKRVLLHVRVILHELQSLRRIASILREEERVPVSVETLARIPPSSSIHRDRSSLRAYPRSPPRVHDASHLLAFVRTFIVMYRDIPCTPDSFCSVHSRVTWRRTSFFLLAAVTTRTPRRDEDAAATLETWALSALVLATLTRAASMTTRRAASTM